MNNRPEDSLKVRLKYWRIRKGFSVDRLVEVARVSPVTISRIENSGLVPRVDVLHRLATALGITVEELVIDVTEDVPAA